MPKNIEELNNSPVQELDISQFPEKVNQEPEPTREEDQAVSAAFDALNALTNSIEEENKVLEEQVKEEQEIEDFINDEDADLEEAIDEVDEDEEESEDDEDEEASLEDNIIQFKNISEEDLDEDLKELLGEDGSSSSETEDDYINIFKDAIKEKIKPVSETLDISTFTVVNEPISVNATLQDEKHDDVAWVLYSSGRCSHMERYLGSDIEDLNPDTSASGMGRLDTLRKVYRSLYEHTTDVNKPDFEGWLKSTSYLDIKNIYANVYRGAFEGNNYMTYQCPECDNIWLSDDIPIMDLVEFDSTETEEKFNDILERESSEIDKLYVTEVVPISNRYAFSFKEPSIYNVVFENASLPKKFTDKYEGMLSILMYIDTIYFIDSKNKQLKPIALKTFKNDLRKTTKVKVYTYAKILKALNSDEYNSLAKYMLAINKRSESIKYVKPACTCPKCGKEVPKEEQDMQSMLFNRASLVSILNA